MNEHIEITPEEEEELVKKIAEYIHKQGMGLAAILFLEGAKPLTYLWSQMGYIFLSPFFPALGDSLSNQGEKILQVFEKRKNVQKLITMLEDLREGGKTRIEKSKEAPRDQSNEKKAVKKGWRRFLPF